LSLWEGLRAQSCGWMYFSYKFIIIIILDTTTKITPRKKKKKDLGISKLNLRMKIRDVNAFEDAS
jgi:hypothetical protein